MAESTRMKRYAEWGARLIIAVIVLLLTVAFNRLEDNRRKMDDKVDKVVFDKHVEENREEVLRQSVRNDEVVRMLIKIQTDVEWMRKEREKTNGKG